MSTKKSHRLRRASTKILDSAKLHSTALESDEINRALTDCDKFKSKFFAMMSHEFRTPLNSIAGAVYYLKKKKVSKAEQKAFIDIIYDETNKLIDLFDRILNISLLEKENEGELADLFLLFISEAMDLNRCSLMLMDEATKELTIKSAIGFKEDIIRKTRIKAGEKIAGWVASENKPLLVKDIETYPGISKKNSAQYNTKSLLCLPIAINNKVIGVLNLNNKASGSPFEKKDLYFASSVTDRFSRIIQKVQSGKISDEPQFKTISKSLDTLVNAEQKYRKKNGRSRNKV